MSESTEFWVTLANHFVVRPTAVFEQTLQCALGPLACQAGRPLKFERGRSLEPRGELTLTFDEGTGNAFQVLAEPDQPPEVLRGPHTVLILGNGDGTIYVGAHEELRVWSGPRRQRGGMDYTTQIVRLFENGEPDFARAVANTAIHELGHMIANLEHSANPHNFMYSMREDVDRATRAYRQLGTREAARKHWYERKFFTDDQTARLVQAIAAGKYAVDSAGGFTIDTQQP